MNIRLSIQSKIHWAEKKVHFFDNVSILGIAKLTPYFWFVLNLFIYISTQTFKNSTYKPVHRLKSVRINNKFDSQKYRITLETRPDVYIMYILY